MTDTSLATAEDCRPLYDLMKRVRDLAPWEWMEEIDIFGVQHPDTGEIAFVSIMGMAGEHFAISAYLGERGLYGFWRMQELGPFMQPQDILNVPQLQASFEDREMLDKHDFQIIKTLGLKYRGRSAWPMFRSYRPGYAPWHIEAHEAQFLTYVLEQVLEVAPRVKQQPDIIEPEVESDFMVRVASKAGDTLHWEDKVLPTQPPPLLQLTIEIDEGLMETVARLPRKKFKVEADFFMMPSGVAEKGQRPYFPYILMMLDATNGMVLGFDMLTPVPSLEQMWGQVGPTALQLLAKTGAMPSEIRVRDNVLYGMLQPFVDELKLKVTQVDMLPMLDAARMGLEDFLG